MKARFICSCSFSLPSEVCTVASGDPVYVSKARAFAVSLWRRILLDEPPKKRKGLCTLVGRVEREESRSSGGAHYQALRLAVWDHECVPAGGCVRAIRRRTLEKELSLQLRVPVHVKALGGRPLFVELGPDAHVPRGIVQEHFSESRPIVRKACGEGRGRGAVSGAPPRTTLFGLRAPCNQALSGNT